MKLLARILLPLLILASGAMAIRWLMNNRPVQPTRPQTATVPVVEAVPLLREDVAIVIHSQGIVRPRIRTQLVSQISGAVVSVADGLRDGASFRKDDLLVQIDPRDYTIAVAAAEASLQQARLTVAELKLQAASAGEDVAFAEAAVATAKLAIDEEEAQAQQAARDWQRLHPDAQAPDLVLRKPQLAAAAANLAAATAKTNQARINQQLVTAKAETAEAAVAVAQSNLDKAKLNLARTEIRAPYDGRILTQEVDLGRFLSAGTAIATVYPIDEAEIRLPVSQEELAWIRLPENGAASSVRLQATVAGVTHVWDARLLRSEAAVDSDTRQLSLIAAVDAPFTPGPDNRPPLRVGQFLSARIHASTLSEHYRLPRNAVRIGNEILLVTAQGTLQRKTVTPVFNDRRDVVVADAMPEGTRLCTSLVAFMSDGARVRVKGDPKPAGDDRPKGAGKPQ